MSARRTTPARRPLCLLRACLGAARGTEEWAVVSRRLDEAQAGVRLTGVDVGDELPAREHVLGEAALRAGQQVAVIREQPKATGLLLHRLELTTAWS